MDDTIAKQPSIQFQTQIKIFQDQLIESQNQTEDALVGVCNHTWRIITHNWNSNISCFLPQMNQFFATY